METRYTDRPPWLLELIEEIGQKSIVAGDCIMYYVPNTVMEPQWLRTARVLRVEPGMKYPLHLDSHDKIDCMINKIKWYCDGSGIVDPANQSGWRSIRMFDLVAGEVSGVTRRDALRESLATVIADGMSSTSAFLQRNLLSSSGVTSDRSNTEGLEGGNINESSSTSSGRPTEQTPQLGPVVNGSWVRVWKVGDNVGDVPCESWEEYLKTLPSFRRPQSDSRKCTMDHLSRNEDKLHLQQHLMRRIITACRSKHCSHRCPCRYRVLSCEEVLFAEVYVQSEHVVDVSGVDLPESPKLTVEMKGYLRDRLEENSSIVASKLFALLSRKISNGEFSIPAPKPQQVAGFVKRWRSKNKKDTMQPVIDICSGYMYTSLLSLPRGPEELIILCDKEHSDSGMSPKLGDGSPSSPFRIGLTCLSLLEAYVKAQENEDCNTILHLDSTHKIVHQNYPVFILGISDRRGCFFPLAYCCTSKRRNEDVTWLLRSLKEVVKDLFNVDFNPMFVMTDADDAHYNACASELPNSTILMCWFHVLQNVRKHTIGQPPRVVGMFFRDFNAMHFARSRGEFLDIKKQAMERWSREELRCASCRKISLHFKKQWINSKRFSNWQAFMTKSGHAATNNPVETYHRTLKLVNDSSKTTPTELVHGLDASRLAFIHSRTTFHTVPTVSSRLRALYNGYAKGGDLTADTQPPSGDTCTSLVYDLAEVQTTDHGAELDMDDENPDDVTKPIKSLHIR